MRSSRALSGWWGAVTAMSLCGCGPELGHDDFPHNCGVEGPVELLEVFPSIYADVQRVGDHYLIEYTRDAQTVETYAVDRCGTEQVRLRQEPLSTTTRIAPGGRYVLACDEDTSEMTYLDPTGAVPPRPLFPAAVGGCRVVPLGRGLAAQQSEGSTVWFHPDPSDPSAEPLVVTDAARIVDPSWQLCWPRFDCKSAHPLGLDLSAAGDELLVVLQTEELLAFSASTHEVRILDEGPVRAMDVLAGEDLVVVSRHLGPNLVVQRETGAALEFCCYDDYEPIRRFGDWLVKGSFLPPLLPDPSEWTNFRARHLPSGSHTEISGTEAWHVLAPLSADTIMVDIGPSLDPEGSARYVVWPATGERQRVELPGDLLWTMPGTHGVYSTRDDTSTYGLYHLAGPDQPPRTLLRDATIAFPTVHGRIVFEEGVRDASFTPLPLSVMLPDERVVTIHERALWTMAPVAWDEQWISDVDEVVYVAEDDDGRWMLQRTVLP